MNSLKLLKVFGITLPRLEMKGTKIVPQEKLNRVQTVAKERVDLINRSINDILVDVPDIYIYIDDIDSQIKQLEEQKKVYTDKINERKERVRELVSPLCKLEKILHIADEDQTAPSEGCNFDVYFDKLVTRACDQHERMTRR